MLTGPDGLTVDFNAARDVRFAAVGKAAPGMLAQALMWTRAADAVAVTPHDATVMDADVIVAGHPVPTDASVAAGERLFALAEATGPDDVLVVLVSGGGSALAERPAVPLADAQALTRAMLASDMPIEAMNAVRTHVSLVKGGRLAAAARGRVVTLVIADVPNDDAALVASGPTVADASTFQDAVSALRRHGVWDAAPVSVRDHLLAGVDGKIEETVKPGDPALGRAEHRVIAGNATALDAAAAAASQLGYDTFVVPEGLSGDAAEAGARVVDVAWRAKRGDLPVRPPCCVLFGGETVVDVGVAPGAGGRNQHLALATVPGLSGAGVVAAAFATDGVDGPTDAAGAIVDSFTLARANALGLDVTAHAVKRDSHAFFDALHDLVRTGPSGTNVRDVVVLLVK